MKARMLCLLLLSACTDSDVAYDYALAWECQSPDGCERDEEVTLVDRLNVSGDFFFFQSTRDMIFFEDAQSVDLGTSPAGCSWLYSFSLFGYELEPSKLCRTEGGFALELSIPNVVTTGHSQWLVEAQELGAW